MPKLPEVIVEYRYATFWQRAAAAIVDGWVLAALSVPVWLGSRAILPESPTDYAAIIGTTLLATAYEIGLVARTGQTLGKMVAGVQIRRVGFAPVRLKQATLRYAVALALCLYSTIHVFRTAQAVPPEILSATSEAHLMMFASAIIPDVGGLALWARLAWGGAELVTMLLHPKRRAIHDLIAGTVVVQSLPSPRTPAFWIRHRRAVSWVAMVLPAFAAIPLHFAEEARLSEPSTGYFPGGALRSEFTPVSGDTMPTLTVYWENGAPRHVLRMVFDMKGLGTSWQQFDDHGVLSDARTSRGVGSAFSSLLNEGLASSGKKKTLQRPTDDKGLVSSRDPDAPLNPVAKAKGGHAFGEPEAVWIRGIHVAYGGYGLAPKDRSREDAIGVIKDCLRRLRAGDAFQAVARDSSEGDSAESGGEYGRLVRGALTAEIEAAAFALPVGGISGMVEGAHGFSIVQRYR